MEIRQMLVDSSKYNLKCPNKMTPKFLIVHNTANDASANNEISYMRTNNSSTSFHIAVDDIEAVQGIPFDRNSWNAGDGTNGNGNRNGIAIEICYSKSGGDKWEKAKTNAVELIVQLLNQYGWGIEQVKKHQDFSGKYCPHRILDEGWEGFLNRIREKLGQTPVEIPPVSNGSQNTDIYNDGLVNCIFDIQEWLNRHYNTGLALDNMYGPKTKAALIKGLQTELNTQYKKGLVVDGIWGTKTYNACINVKQGAEGNITMLIQMALFIKGYNISMDKKFGSKTARIVGQFQNDNGLTADKIVGKNTFQKLFA